MHLAAAKFMATAAAASAATTQLLFAIHLSDDHATAKVTTSVLVASPAKALLLLITR